MLILLALFGYVACGCVIAFLYYRWTKTKEALFASRRDAVRARAWQEAAKRAVVKAEARCRELFGQIETSLDNTRQALGIAQHVEIIGQQLHSLVTFVTHPELDAAPARHALPLESPGPRPMPGPDVYAEYEPGSEISFTNGHTVSYFTD